MGCLAACVTAFVGGSLLGVAIGLAELLSGGSGHAHGRHHHGHHHHAIRHIERHRR